MADNIMIKSTNVSLLVAAIQHLKLLYLQTPNSCLLLLISRNYGLLLELSSPEEQSEWKQEHEIWQQHCQKCSPHADINTALLNQHQSL